MSAFISCFVLHQPNAILNSMNWEIGSVAIFSFYQVANIKTKSKAIITKFHMVSNLIHTRVHFNGSHIPFQIKTCICHIADPNLWTTTLMITHDTLQSKNKEENGQKKNQDIFAFFLIIYILCLLKSTTKNSGSPSVESRAQHVVPGDWSILTISHGMGTKQRI